MAWLAFFGVVATGIWWSGFFSCLRWTFLLIFLSCADLIPDEDRGETRDSLDPGRMRVGWEIMFEEIRDACTTKTMTEFYELVVTPLGNGFRSKSLLRRGLVEITKLYLIMNFLDEPDFGKVSSWVIFIA